MGYLDNNFDTMRDPIGLASGSIDFNSPTFGQNPNAGNLQQAAANEPKKDFVPKTYGQMQGYLLRQENDRANEKLQLAKNEDNRAERTQGLTEEAFGWKREDHKRDEQLRAGILAAANDGGYEAVIKYLEKADPAKAIEFTKNKLSLDKDIMSNEVMKATSQYQIQDAMVESYGLLGKMGYALLQMPANMRQDAYDKILPMVKKINPNAPDKVTDATSMFLTAAAQATPANQLFKWGTQQTQAQSSVGKLNADIEAALKKGATIDGQSAQDEGLRALYAERQKSQSQAAYAGAQLTKTQLAQTNNQFQANETVSKNLLAASPINLDYVDSYTGIRAAVSTLQQDPNNPQAQAALGRSFVKAYNKGVASDADNAIQYGTYGFSELYKKVQSMVGGQAVNLTAQDAKNIYQMNESLKDQKMSYQKQVESEFQNSITSYGNLVDWKNVRKPSEMMTKYLQEQQEQKDAAQGQIPPSMQDWAKKAAARGYSPEEIKMKIGSYMQQKAAAGKQQGQVHLTPADYLNEGKQ